MADVEYIKSTKKLVNQELTLWRLNKYKEGKARITDAEGLLHGQVKIPQIDLVTFMNMIIKSWFANNLDRVKERWPELRMVPHALAQQLGWTPDMAFQDYNPTCVERETAAAILPPSVEQVNTRSWVGKSVRCVERKCSRKATHRYVGTDRLPRFCALHRLEGMFELGPWKPGDTAPRELPRSKLPPSKVVTANVPADATPAHGVEEEKATENYATESNANPTEVEKPEKKRRGRPKQKPLTPRTSILTFFSPPGSQETKPPTPLAVTTPPMHTQGATPYPPLLLPPLVLKFKSSVVDPVKEMWEGQGPYLTVQGVTFGFAELSRMLHVHGPKAYINENIIDVIGGLMNEEDGDFWVFQAHLYEKFTRNDGVERWIQKSMKKWERKYGGKSTFQS